MKPADVVTLLRPRRRPAPYGAPSLARAFSIDDIRRVAHRRLPSAIEGYLEGGGESEYTLRHNRSAFDAWELEPTRLVDVSHLSTATTLLGSSSTLPIALAPVGAPRLFHPDGELAVARAAAAGVPYGISTLATVAMDDLKRTTSSPLWLQLYVWGDRGLARNLVAEAKRLGYRAIILSVDVTVRSKRQRERRGGMELPVPHPTIGTVLDGFRHPAWSWRFVTSATPGFPNIGIASVTEQPPDIASMFDGTVSWRDVEWLRDEWDGPLAVKGILRADDAVAAAERGVDAVIVSNHGGRQGDHVPATIEVLPSIVDALDGRAEVLVDSGIRRGGDVLTALALGARGVLVGRAYLYGLAAAGEPGVRHALDILEEELRIEMGLCGVTDVHDVSRDKVRRRPDETRSIQAGT